MSSAPIVFKVMAMLLFLFLAACQHMRVPVGSSTPTVVGGSTATLPSVSGPEYPAAEPAATTGASVPGEDVSNAEAEWRKMLEPYLTKPALAPQPAMPVTKTAPVLTPLAGDTVRVGILLPLSGPNASLGTAMMNAAQMALFDFADADFELLPHDTAGQPEQASFAATMVIGDGASLVVGPLLSRSTHAVGPISRAAGIPVIALSSDSTVAGDGIYSLGFLPRNEVDRVTAFAMSRGLRRFAVLAPDDPYGVTVVEAFRTALARYGGTLVQIAFYNRSGADIDGVDGRAHV